MSDVNPVEFGELKGRMAGLEVTCKRLEVQVDLLRLEVEKLVAIANQGKGGLWVFRTVYVTAGGLLAWALPQLVKRLFP